MEDDNDPGSFRGIYARRRKLMESLRDKANPQMKRKVASVTSDKASSSVTKKRKSEHQDQNESPAQNTRSSTKKRKPVDNGSEIGEPSVKKSKIISNDPHAQARVNIRTTKKQNNESYKYLEESDHENGLDFDSDDSVKDKDYNPYGIEVVKRVLFTPIKMNVQQLRAPMIIDSPSVIQLPELPENLDTIEASPSAIQPPELPENLDTIEASPSAIQPPELPENLDTIEASPSAIQPPELPDNLNNIEAAPSVIQPPELPENLDTIEASPSAIQPPELPDNLNNIEAAPSVIQPPELPENLDTIEASPSAIQPPELPDNLNNIEAAPSVIQPPELPENLNNIETAPRVIQPPELPENLDTIEAFPNNERSRKRIRNEASWLRVRSKNARLRGSPYKSSVAKKKPEIAGRRLGSPCACRAKCFEKISQHKRLIIFNNFWKESTSWDQRRQYVVSCTKKSRKATMKTGADPLNERRKFTYTYHLKHDEDAVKVFKVMFLKTLSVSEKFVQNSLAKTLESGLVEPDQRGKHTPGNKTPEPVITSVCDHIASYPCYESHYTRKKSQKKYLGPELNLSIMYRQYVEMMKEKEVEPKLIAKEWLYRHVFNTKFNLSFKLPGVDTCDDCDAFQRKQRDAVTDEQKKEIVEEKKSHDRIAQERYDLKAADKVSSRDSEGKKLTVMFDLQKCMPTPCLTNTKSFYLRKLWTLNLTIYDSTEKKASNMVWSENISGRGGNEIASCLIRWAQENLPPDVEEITFWSDNCAGQNRNVMVIMSFMWILNMFPNLKKVNHKFLLKGHTHMEVDHIHSMIERKKKQISTMEIAVPRDWSQFIKTCGGKRPFQVFDMTLNDFYDMTVLYKKTGPFILRKKNKEGQEFKISKCVWIQLNKEKPGVVNYKMSFDQEGFSEISFMRQTRLTMPDSLPTLRTNEKEISTAKYNDLMTLLQWVPAPFHDFYKSLIHSASASDVPEAE